MKYSLMSLMVDDVLRHEKVSPFLAGLLRMNGVPEPPADADTAYRILNEHGVPMKNGIASFEDLVRFTKENDFDGLDMMGFQMELPGAEMREILSRHGVVLSAVNVIMPFSEALTEEAYQDFLRNARAEMEQAAAAGTDKVLLVPAGYGLREGQTREGSYRMMSRGLRDCVAYGKELGLTVSTETLEDISVPYGSIGEMRRLFSDVPEARYTFDAGNPVVANEDPAEMYETFRERVVAVHFKDLGYGGNPHKSYRCANGDVVSVVPLGSGKVDFREILRRLSRDHYTGYITLEGGVPARDKWGEALGALKLFREMEKEIGE